MNERLTQLHQLCLQIQEQDFKDRLQCLAEFFLGTQYGPWLNGSGLQVPDDCKYDLTTLDCVTYGEVVLALVKIQPKPDYAKFVADFINMLCLIHYKNGKVSFLNSNHFFCIDWIENNKFIVEDITHNLTKTYKIAETTIDKLTWFKRHQTTQNWQQEFTPEIMQQLAPQISRVPHIESEELLGNYQQFVQKFPEYCIVTIVRPNWDITDRIGTHLNISHLGLCFKDQQNSQLKFFHATIENKLIVQETLDVYLQRQQAIPTIRGINVLAISPGFYHYAG